MGETGVDADAGAYGAVMLHVGGASTASLLVGVLTIFVLLFALSFAFGPVPAGKRRFSPEWLASWTVASLPRLIVAGGFSALLFVGSITAGNNGNTGSANASSCAQPLPPLTGNPVTDARIVVAIDGMQKVAAQAADGDADGVRTLFYTTDAHNLTHDIDATLREQDPELARRLCLSVIVLENQMAAGQMDTDVVAREAAAIADVLTEARTAVDFAFQATAAAGVGPCTTPLGPVTDQPLTGERLRAAIDTTSEVAAQAAGSDPETLRMLCFGDAHNITHDIDGPLRASDGQLAMNLCGSILVLETEISGGFRRAIIEREARASADLLERAGEALGILD